MVNAAVEAPFGTAVVGEPAERVKAAPVEIRIQTLSRALWCAAGLVLGLGILREIVQPIIGFDTPLEDLRHFALDSEQNMQAWLESILMALAAALLTIVAALSRRHDPANRFHWAGLAIVFLLFSIDESVSFHESTMDTLRAEFRLTGVLHFSWVVIAAPLLIAFAVVFIPFLLRLPRATMLRFVIAGSVFVVGAFGMELVGGYLVSTEGDRSLPYRLSAMCEESLEIVGVTLFVSALLRLLAARMSSLRFCYGESGPVRVGRDKTE
ncbi:MAG TPA: hypothetical protein VGA77_05030 [Propylenella sp.]